jgi:predicted amidophosphoribosyltransferase
MNYNCEIELNKYDLDKLSTKFNKNRLCPKCRRNRHVDALRCPDCKNPFPYRGLKLYCDDCSQRRYNEKNRRRYVARNS